MSKELQKKEIKNQIIEFEKNISDSVQNRITVLAQEGRLNLPENYSVGNALASAWLILQNTKDKSGALALHTCTKESVANALLDMTVMGLNPAKKHGYFIAYGNQMTWFTSYFGKCAAIKRIKGIECEPVATLIYQGDEITFGHNELGEEAIIEHVSSWKNKLTGNIEGAYATVMYNNIKRSAVMTMAEIKEAWTKNPSPANRRDHVDFAGEFAKRTVINRLVKMILQTTNDDDLLAETIILNEDKHYDFEGEVVSEEVKAKREIAISANTGEVIGFEEEPEQEPVKEKVEAEVKPQQQKLIDDDQAPWA